MKYIVIGILAVYILFLFKPFIVEGKLPIPADTIAGLYHPWRDFFLKDYPTNVPFKNFQITDPVRQQYPWRKLSIEKIRNLELPLWNPYSFSGTPLLANFQSAAFYPLNLLFLILDFNTAWSLLVLLQLLLGALFIYLYLRNLRLHALACSIGALAWIGSGFFVAWQQWNTVVQTCLWLPLILLAVDKIIAGKKSWFPVFIFCLAASFLGGYLQPFFYIFLIVNAYIIFRIFETRKYRLFLQFIIYDLSFIILALPQLFATFQFIFLSARDLDQSNWMRPDWFLPWQNLIQLIAPDFFGNPATLNYFGVWNYQEFVSYIGLAPLFFALIGITLFRRLTVKFFVVALVSALVFALPTEIAKLPFIFQIPLISTSQPSRLVFIICFCLAILAAFGADALLSDQGKLKNKVLFLVSGGTLVIFWLIFLAASFNPISLRNMYLPVITFVLAAALLLQIFLFPRFKKVALILLVFLTVFDLFRFGNKFLPFTDSHFLFPTTKINNFLQEKAQSDIFRIAAVDDRLFPPNFGATYKLQFISGYDPLYLRRYGEFVAAMERNSPNIDPPFGFNRIIVPKNYASKFFDLLGVRYVLSLDTISTPKYKLVLEEGLTKLYENSNYLPRVFFAEKVQRIEIKQDIFDALFSPNFNPRTDLIISEANFAPGFESTGSARIISYAENEILVEADVTKNVKGGHGYLILTDPYYPIWHAEVDGKKTDIFAADYLFRGVIVPEGRHQVRFFAKLF